MICEECGEEYKTSVEGYSYCNNIECLCYTSDEEARSIFENMTLDFGNLVERIHKHEQKNENRLLN